MERRNFLKTVAGASGFALTAVGDVEASFREQDDLPTFKELSDEHNIGAEKLMLALEGDGWRAIASPDVSSSGNRHGSPFAFVTVGDAPSNEVLGDEFADEFESRVDAVWEMIEGSDDPLDAIMDLEPDDLVVAPTEDDE